MPVDALTAAIGKRLRTWREEAGRRQEDVALAARACGLKWGRSTVAMLEGGSRRLEVSELLLLPMIVQVATGISVTLLDVIAGNEDVMVELTPEAAGPRDEIAKLLDPALTPMDLDGTRWHLPGLATLGEEMEAFVEETRKLRQPSQWRRSRGLTAEMLAMLERDAAGEAERVAARKLGVAPKDVALASRRCWGRSLTEMRDARAAQVAAVDELGAESRRALRGHATRDLLEELRPYLETEK